MDFQDASREALTVYYRKNMLVVKHVKRQTEKASMVYDEYHQQQKR